MKRNIGILLVGATLVLAAGPAAAFTREPVLSFDKSLGQSSVAGIENGINPRRDANGVRREVRGPFGRPVATAIGNLLTIEAAPHSTVIVNAIQVNHGNQFAINGDLDLD